MAVLLSDEELEALEGLPHLHRCLYIFGIRRYMDYQTGITGIKRKISYKSLSEEIYIDIRRGVREDSTKSRDQVKRALNILEKKKLIERKSIVTKDEKQLILKCLLAHTDKCIKNKAAPWPPHSPAPQAAPVEEQEYTVNIDTSETTQEQSRPASRPAQNEKAALHPISGNYTKLNYTVAPNFLSTEENKFLNLFTDLKLSVNLAGDLKAITTAKALIKAGVTLEVASEVLKIKLAAYKNKRTPHPSYFKQAIIDYKQELDTINQPQETDNEKPHRVVKPNSNKRNWETLHEQGLRELEESKQRTKR